MSLDSGNPLNELSVEPGPSTYKTGKDTKKVNWGEFQHESEITDADDLISLFTSI